MVEKNGVNSVDNLVKQYQKNYKGRYTEYQEMLDEIANDGIAGLFTTEDAAKQFIGHVDRNYKDSSRRHQILEGISNFIQHHIWTSMEISLIFIWKHCKNIRSQRNSKCFEYAIGIK